MTKKEFLEYVNGFNREAGEFTDEELYEIGCKYKTLPLSEKNWSELVELLGVKGQDGEMKTGEAFRTWIKSKQYQDNTIQKNVTLISGQTIEDISFEDFEKQTEEIKRELYKQQVKTRDSLNAYRSELRKEARAEDFQDMFLKAIENTPALYKYRDTAKVDEESKSEAIVLFSDLHIGMKINKWYNKFDLEIARKRVQKYVDSIIKECKRAKVQVIHFINLGDMIHGNIHVTGRIESEMLVNEQVINAMAILSDVLNQLQAAFPEVIYRSCTDNHSRMTQDYKQHVEAENYSSIIDFYLKTKLAGTRVTFIDDNLDEEIGMFKLMNGKKVIFAHGHHDNYNACFQKYIGATREFIDFILLGHFHSSKLKSFQGAKVIVNGCIDGVDQFAASKGLYDDPEQTFIIFQGNDFAVHHINLK